jgi:hypothetical protein
VTVAIDEDSEPGGINLQLVSLVCGLVVAVAAFAAVGGIRWVDTGGQPSASYSRAPSNVRVLPPASFIPGRVYPAEHAIEVDFSLATTFAADLRLDVDESR